MTDKGIPRFVKVMVAVVIAGLLVALGAAWQISKIRQAEEQRAACVAEVLADVIQATNERTTFTEELSTANENQLKAFQALVIASLKTPPPTEDESRELVIDYRDALAEYFDVSAKARQKRENFPYPTEQEIAACR